MVELYLRCLQYISIHFSICGWRDMTFITLLTPLGCPSLESEAVELNLHSHTEALWACDRCSRKTHDLPTKPLKFNVPRCHFCGIYCMLKESKITRSTEAAPLATDDLPRFNHANKSLWQAIHYKSCQFLNLMMINEKACPNEATPTDVFYSRCF